MMSIPYDPVTMSEVKYIPEGHTCYDKILVNIGSLTLEQLMNYLKNIFPLEILRVNVDEFDLYNNYMFNDVHRSRMPIKVEDIYCIVK